MVIFRSIVIASAIKSKEIDSDSKPVLRVSENENSPVKYFKDALLNKNKLKCYIDMGCRVVALREDVASKMNISYYETEMEPLIGYGNGRG